jgi:hypothetical protein
MCKTRSFAAAAVFCVLVLLSPAPSAPQGQIVTANKVTAVYAYVLSQDVAYTDRVKINFAARITSRSNGTVDYRWLRSDGAHSRQQHIAFTKGGDLEVTATWTLGVSAAGKQIWEAVEILYPTPMQSNKAICTVPAPHATDGGGPIRITVTLSNMSAGQSYSCSNKPNYMDPTEMKLWGGATIKNNSSRTLMFTEKLPNYSNHYLFLALLFPLRKEVAATRPIWPRTFNDPNWGAYEFSFPDTLAPNGEFFISLQNCYPCFDRHPIVYVGAIYTDKATGRQIASNLAKWEERW